MLVQFSRVQIGKYSPNPELTRLVSTYASFRQVWDEHWAIPY